MNNHYDLDHILELINSGQLDLARPLLVRFLRQRRPRAIALLGSLIFTGGEIRTHPPSCPMGTEGRRAVRLLRRAVALGDGLAAHNLATLYAVGMPDVPRNRDLSRHYYRLARTLGCQLAPDDFYDK